MNKLKLPLLLLWILSLGLPLTAQKYEISFAILGTNEYPEKVKIENITQSEELTINGNDILLLIKRSPLDIYNMSEDLNLKVFPNPTIESTNIEFHNPTTGRVNIDIYSTDGKLLINQNNLLPQGNNAYTLSGLGIGAYIVNISTQTNKSSIVIISEINAGGQPELSLQSTGNSYELQRKSTKVELPITGSLVRMYYNENDVLNFTAYLGEKNTNLELVPTENAVIEFSFSLPFTNFVANDTISSVNKTIMFTDNTLNNPTEWLWDFGDGSATSNLQNPTHSYSSAGIYSVSLTSTNANGDSTLLKTDYIEIGELAEVNFSVDDTIPYINTKVNFTGEIAGNADNWQWNFGDGNTVQNILSPSHTYTEIGDYSVSFTATNKYGDNKLTKYVKVGRQTVTGFNASLTLAAVKQEIAFTDTSLYNPTFWLWDFGDGSEASTLQNPTHSFATPGNYNITLTAGSVYGDSTITKINYIEIGNLPVTEFSVNDESTSINTTLSFSDKSTNNPVAWNWNFGDGNTSTDQNPEHSYDATGSYTVTLTATNIYGDSTLTKTDFIEVGISPEIGFIADDTIAAINQIITFTDQSSNTPISWTWNFGDGSTSTDQNPMHAFTSAGNYNVTLTSSNIYGENTLVKSEYIEVGDLSTVDFSASKTKAAQNESIAFSDLSNNKPTSWLWNFGDGSTSTEQNPSHSYTSAGTYTVTLTVNNKYGENNSSKTNYITIGAPPVSDFTPSKSKALAEEEITFTNATTSSVSYTSSWNFGDGTTSTYRSPKHTYASNGTYTVTLTTINTYGTGTTITKVVTIGDPSVASFSADKLRTDINQTISFTASATNNPAAWYWEFGDGNTSILQNPSHTYTTAGTYTVSLTTTNEFGQNKTTKVRYLIIYGTVTDIDGNTYKTVVIGNQEWMAENLRVIRFNDGTNMTITKDVNRWATATSPYYCWPDNSYSNVPEYGVLYNAYVVQENKNVCPTGWHVPDYSDWGDLKSYLAKNGYNVNGTISYIEPGRLTGPAIASNTYWVPSTMSMAVGNDVTKNNTCGFNAKPAGYRKPDGTYYGFNWTVRYWEKPLGSAYTYFNYLYSGSYGIERTFNSTDGFTSGKNIRCVKD